MKNTFFLPLVLHSSVGPTCWLRMNGNIFLRGELVNPKPEPQPGGPEYRFYSGSSPLTCPGPPCSYATACSPLNMKPQLYIKVGIHSIRNRQKHSLHMSSVYWSVLPYLRVCSFSSAISLSLVVFSLCLYATDFPFSAPPMPHTYFF